MAIHIVLGHTGWALVPTTAVDAANLAALYARFSSTIRMGTFKGGPYVEFDRGGAVAVYDEMRASAEMIRRCTGEWPNAMSPVAFNPWYHEFARDCLGGVWSPGRSVHIIPAFKRARS